MPNIKSAKKKLRQDVKRTKANATVKRTLKKGLKAATLKPAAKKLKEAIKGIAKAAKKGVIAKNKAARLQSRLTKKPKK